MIRILQVLDTLDVCAGMTSVVVNYHRRIDRGRVQFDYLVFSKSKNGYDHEIEALGGHVYWIPRPGLNKTFRRDTTAFFSVHAKDYVALHCHMLWAPAVFGPFARKYGISHVIAHSHSTKFSDKPASALRNMGMVLLDRFWATHYMACSEDAKRLFYFVPKGSITILRNAIETERFAFDLEKRREARTALEADENTVLVGHVGRFSPEKNHGFLLKTFREFKRRVPNSKLILAGDGPLRAAIQRQVDQMNLRKNVVLLGTRNDMDCFYAGIDMLLLPSLFEGVPMVLLEAQASSLPCLVSTAVSSIADLTGLVRFYPLEAGEEAWANQMEELMERSSTIDRDWNTKKQFLEKGYDLTGAADFLADYYEKLDENV